MFNINYEEIIEKIIKETSLDRKEIENKIKDKLRDLSDLVSKEGAAHIVANELNVKIYDKIEQRKLKIKDLLPGLSSVDILGRIVTIFGVREFNTGKREGKVASFVIGDETGTIRVALWDTKHIKEIEDENIKEGDVIRIKNGYSKDNNGQLELHVGNRGKLEKSDEEVKDVKIEIITLFKRKKLNEIEDNDSGVGIIGTIVQVFEPRFYNICSECGKKMVIEENKFKCEEHGFVAEKQVPVVNFYFDDGSDNIRVVAFRNQAEQLIGENFKIENFDDVRKELLGKQILVIGRIVRNDMFSRLEFVAREIKEVNPAELVKEYLK